MRKLVLFVVVVASLTGGPSRPAAGVIPSWESRTGKLGFMPLSNEVTKLRSVDDAGGDRGRTLQLVLINSHKVFTTFKLEFTADYNFDYTPGQNRDHYVELSLVKPVTGLVSLNYQRVLSTFEAEAVNQFGVRLAF